MLLVVANPKNYLNFQKQIISVQSSRPPCAKALECYDHGN